MDSTFSWLVWSRAVTKALMAPIRCSSQTRSACCSTLSIMCMLSRILPCVAVEGSRHHKSQAYAVEGRGLARAFSHYVGKPRQAKHLWRCRCKSTRLSILAPCLRRSQLGQVLLLTCSVELSAGVAQFLPNCMCSSGQCRLCGAADFSLEGVTSGTYTTTAQHAVLVKL